MYISEGWYPSEKKKQPLTALGKKKKAQRSVFLHGTRRGNMEFKGKGGAMSTRGAAKKKKRKDAPPANAKHRDHRFRGN